MVLERLVSKMTSYVLMEMLNPVADYTLCSGLDLV